MSYRRINDDAELFKIGSVDVENSKLKPNHFAETKLELSDLQSIKMNKLVNLEWSELQLREKIAKWAEFFQIKLPSLPFTDESIVVVMGIPQVAEDKKKRLESALNKKFGPLFDCITNHFVVSLVASADGQYRTALVAVDCPLTADQIVKTLDGFEFSKKSTLSVCVLDDIESRLGTPPNPPFEAAPLVLAEDTISWVEDPLGREQFLLSYHSDQDGDVVQAYWNDPYTREHIVVDDSYTRAMAGVWSPLGTYLLTLHGKGLIIRNNNLNEIFLRVSYEDLMEFQISPCERYILLWDGASEGSTFTVSVYDLIAQSMCHTIYVKSLKSVEKLQLSDLCQFTKSSNFIVVQNIENILVIDVNDGFKYLKKDDHTFMIDLSFTNCWSISPSDDTLCVYSIPKDPKDLTTLRVYRFSESFPGKVKMITNKSIALVLEKQTDLPVMSWHPKGKFLAISTKATKKISKKGRSIYYHVEVIHLRIFGTPSDSIDFEDMVLSTSFCPSMDYLCINTSLKSEFWHLVRTASINKTRKINEVASHTPNINLCEWSPNGSNFVLCGINQDPGTLIFASIKVDESKKVKANGDVDLMISISHKDTHYCMSNISWDNTGRYLSTAVCTSQNDKDFMEKRCESGFIIWSFQGKRLYSYTKGDCIADLSWRPMPTPVLTDEQEKEINENIEAYESKFSEGEAGVRNQAIAQAKELRAQKEHIFNMELESAVNWLLAHQKEQIA